MFEVVYIYFFLVETKNKTLEESAVWVFHFFQYHSKLNVLSLQAIRRWPQCGSDSGGRICWQREKREKWGVRLKWTYPSGRRLFDRLFVFTDSMRLRRKVTLTISIMGAIEYTFTGPLDASILLLWFLRVYVQLWTRLRWGQIWNPYLRQSSGKSKIDLKFLNVYLSCLWPIK